MIASAKAPIFPAMLSRSDRKGLNPTSRRLKTPTQIRRLWRGAGPMQENCSNRGQKRMKTHRRFDLIRMWRRSPYPWPAQIYSHHHRWWELGRGWERSKPNLPEQRHGPYAESNPWGYEGVRIQKRMAQIKKEIESDPYGALFGRRLESSSALNKLEDACASLYRSLFGLDKPAKTGPKDTKAPPKPFKNESTKPPESNSSSPGKPGDGSDGDSPPKASISRYEFDPISGRMVLRKPGANDAITQKGPADEGGSPNTPTNDSERQRTRAGFLSSMNRSDVNSRLAPGEDITSGSSGSSPLYSNSGKKSGGRSGSERAPVASCKSKTGQPESPRQKSQLADVTQSPEIEIGCYKLSSEISSDAGHNKRGESNGSPNTVFRDELPLDDFMRNKSRHLGVDGRDAKERAEDLDLLQASDIRSHYDLKKFSRDPKEQNRVRKESSPLADQTNDANIQDAPKRSENHEQERPLGAATFKSNILYRGTPKDTTKIMHHEKFNSTGQSPPSNSHFAETYRVLAYDPSTLQITHAEANTSLQQVNESDHPSKILSRLSNPAKFLPYFEKMHADGYEISSGGGDILVFRKSFEGQKHTGHSLGQLANEAQEIKAQLRNEPLLNESSTKELKTVCDQRPTPGINDPSPADPSRPFGLEEELLRRSKADSTSEATAGSIARRMLISGAATAATCYAIGVVIEYFRTGGEDGLGIDAFTEFESERRRRDMEKTG